LTTEIDIALTLLDHQLLDKDGRRCGNVDDLAIEDDEVVAILVGPGYWPQRSRWIGRLGSWLGRGGRVRIPWSEVKDIESHVSLRRTAPEYGLGRGDDRLRPYVEKIPGANR
jgi:sporulation protein YlmC with PRC-barrel domain